MEIKIFHLYLEVMTACLNGKYCYGNGAQWHFLDWLGENTIADTWTGTRTIVKNANPIAPHVDMDTYNTLHSFLMQQKCDDEPCTVGSIRDNGFMQMKSSLLNSCKKGEIVHTNGQQWYVRSNVCPTLISIYESPTGEGVERKMTHRWMNPISSWQYIQGHPTYRVVSDEVIDYISRW